MASELNVGKIGVGAATGASNVVEATDPSDHSYLVLDTAVAGKDAMVRCSDEGTAKWEFGKKRTDNKFGIYNYAGGAWVLEISAAGLATFSNGISFGDETLDEYDEGTWVVGFHDAAAAGNASSTTATGHYTRIGRLVTVSFAVFDINISGMTGGNILFFSLPFAVSNATWGTATTRDVEWTSGTMVSCAFGGSTQRGSFMAAQDNGAWSYQTVTDFSGTGDAYVAGQYNI